MRRNPGSALPIFSSFSAPDGDLPSYIYKPSLIGSAWRFELASEALQWKVGSRSGRMAYREIRRIRLSYRPISMQARRFRADIFGDTEVVRILSVTWQTATLLAPQDAEYRRFVVELHARVAASGGTPVLETGLPPWLYYTGLGAVALVAVAFAGLLIRAVLTGSFGGILFLLGFATLFGWQIGRLLQRNTPRRYTLDSIPESLVP